MKNLLIFILLVSTVFSTNLNNKQFTQLSSGYHVTTDMQFLTSMVVSAPAGNVVTGDHNNLANGNTVCPGTTITVNPAVTAHWATPDFSADVAYPYCDGAGCPSMVSMDAVNQNRNILWLSNDDFDNVVADHSDAGHDYLSGHADGSGLPAISFYTIMLGTVNNEPVNYHIVPGDNNPDKEAGVSVDCKGTLRVAAGASSITQSPTSSSNPTFTLNDPGSYAINTQLESVSCLSAVLKHPIAFETPQLAYYRFYAANLPAIPSPMATNTLTLNVQEESEPCNISRISTSVVYSDSDPASYIVTVSVRNNGDSNVNLTNVTSSDADYTATPLSPAACAAFGWPAVWCSSSGFNTPIDSGDTDYALIYLHDTSPANTGGTTLTINGVSSAAGCGDPGACSITVPITNDVFCELAPSSADIPQFTQSRFNVSCTRLDHTPIACTGTNWTLSPSTFGTLADKTNNHALLTPDDPPGSHGTIRYRATSPSLAYCTAGVDVLPAANIPVSCAIAPSSVSFGPGEIVPFTVTCTNSLGAVIPCVGDDWSWGGLAGGFVPGEIDNTHAHAYLDPGSVVGSTGKLFYESEEAICESNVTVIDARVTCDLTPDDVVMNQSTLQHFNFTCTLDGNPVVPDDADYTIIPPLTGSLSGDTPTGVDYTSPAAETEGDVFAAGNVTVPGSPVIGAIDTSHILVPSLTTAINCIIEPSEFAYGPGEVAMFLVDCTNVVGADVPCVGANWYWGDGLTGNFIEDLTDNERAFASPSSSIGSVGKLFYESGEAICSSNVTIVAPVFICDLTPNSATLNFSATQHFDFVCTAQGAIMEPTDADYYLQDGLVGSLSGETIDGVDYTAPASETDGDLLGFGCFVGDCADPEPGVLLGAQDISRITVTNSTEDLCVGPTCDEGDSAYCSILGPDFLVYSPGQTDWIGIMCGPEADTPCSSLSWSITPTTGYIVSSDDDGVRFTITGFPGLSGEITAMVDADHGCSKTFTINSPSCWAYT